MISAQIKTIAHKDQRYTTVGDWWWEEGTLQLRVSDMSDWRYEFLVAVHELVEAYLCRWKGIPQEDVDNWDQEFEEAREKGKYQDWEEPGDHPWAPYHLQHSIASGVERVVGAILGVSWNEYAKEVSSL